jgi:hypothetical protein
VAIDFEVAELVHHIQNVVNVDISTMTSIVSCEYIPSYPWDSSNEVFTVFAVYGTSSDSHVPFELIPF